MEDQDPTEEPTELERLQEIERQLASGVWFAAARLRKAQQRVEELSLDLNVMQEGLVGVRKRIAEVGSGGAGAAPTGVPSENA